ncbi:HAD family hydrolase, partial [Vibrio owensii]
AHAVAVDAASTEADAMRARGASVMYLAVDGVLAGLLSVSDRVKTTTPQALTQLRADGLRIVMATGDGNVTAQSVAKQLGIVEFRGEVKPADK